jgi:trehalose-6-phosphatase
MQTPERLSYIFDQWQELIDRVEISDELFLGFDFDGTLAPIVQSPDLARIDSTIAEELEKLRLYDRVTITILSGRALSDLSRRINLDGVILAGDHGFKIRLEDGREITPIEDFNFREPKLKELRSKRRSSAYPFTSGTPRPVAG